MMVPLPVDTTDEETAPYWAAAHDQRVSVQCCTGCHYLRWPPAPLCPECLSQDGDWTTLAGTGTVWSFAVYHRALHPAFADELPYTVALVKLTEGVQMVGRLLTPTGDADRDGVIGIGDPVRAVFRPVSENATIIEWEPDHGGAEPDSSKGEE